MGGAGRSQPQFKTLLIRPGDPSSVPDGINISLETIVRIIPFLLLGLVTPMSSAAAQQAAPQAEDVVATAAASSRNGVRSADPWRVQVIGSPVAVVVDPAVHPADVEMNARRKVSVTGLVIGAVVGAAVGGALACFANKDDYGVYCAGQNDTKIVIGAVLGAGVGGWIGGVLIPRRR